MQVINIFGTPRTGKTTLAHSLCTKFSSNKHNIEYVNEYARELILSNRSHWLSNQINIFNKQYSRLLINKESEYVVTDSPLLISILFSKLNESRHFEHFEPLVHEVFNTFNNINIFIKNRLSKNVNIGSIHEQDVSNEIKELLIKNNYEFFEVENILDLHSVTNNLYKLIINQ
jgi:nicotinamide riboside kinase